MKILFIDNSTSWGHANFNRIHLKALGAISDNLDVAIRKNPHFDYNTIIEKSNINTIFYFRNGNNFFLKSKLLWRLYSIIQLWYLYLRYPINKYDAIIVSAYDPLVMYFGGVNNKFYLINHNNISQLGNKLKCFITKKLSCKCTHIVFSQNMKDGLIKYVPNAKVEIIPHGCISNKIRKNKQSTITNSSKIIFCPSTAYADKKLIHEILSDKEVHEYIHQNNIHIIIKSKEAVSYTCKNIQIINYYLPSEKYNELFLNSYAILLLYSKEFKYRTSGVLFECFAHNKPVIASNIASFKEYHQHITYNPFINSAKSFIKTIKQLSKHNYQYYIDIDTLSPLKGWNKILYSK